MSEGGEVILRCEGVGKRFAARWVLRGVTLEVRSGEVLGIIGPGGHGKSVLLKVLPMLLSPDEGRVLFKGRDVAHFGPLELAAMRDAIGYLFQNYALFDFMTVFQNVAFPLRQQAVAEKEVARRVVQRLTDVGLGHALALYPSELSGGMKKRVGLARATITNASLTLYDDPTAGLDPVTSSKIFELITAMHTQTAAAATVVVSHDIDRMKVVCDRYVMLQSGRVVFDGPESAIGGADPVVGEFFYGAVNKAAGIL